MDGIKAKIIAPLYALLFSAAAAAGRKVHFCGDVGGRFFETYIEPFRAADVLFALVVFALTLCVFLLILRFGERIRGLVSAGKAPRIGSRKAALISWAALLVMWLPYILSFGPGGVLADSLESLTCAWLNNHHPIVYNMSTKLFLFIGNAVGSPNAGIFLYSVVQALLLSGALAFAVGLLHERSVRPALIVITVLFFGLCPIYPFYAFVMWKDPLFSAALLWMSYVMYLLCRGSSKKLWLHIIPAVFFSCFLRNNGLYIVLACAVLLIPLCGLRSRNVRVFIAAALVCALIQGPVYKSLGIHSARCEALGVPLQQLAYTVTVDEDTIPNSDLEIINNIMPIETLKRVYTPCIVDSIKWGDEYNGDYFENNTGTILKMWLRLLPSHLDSYVKAYMLDTLGFWHPYLQNIFGYIASGVVSNNLGIYCDDMFEDIFSFSIKDGLDSFANLAPIGSGTLFWLMLLSFGVCICINRDRRWCFYIPQILCWGVIMAATPVAFSLRYVYVMALALPINILLPFISLD